MPATGSARSACPILGYPSALKSNVLPTNGDILRHWKLLKMSDEKPGAIPKRHVLTTKISSNVVEIWNSASIPAIQTWSILRRIDSLIDQYLGILKSMKRDSSREKFRNKLSEFEENLRLLFDVAQCQCAGLEECKCPKYKKVPQMEHQFLIDQRGPRKMMIGSVDSKMTSRNLKKFAKRSAAAQLRANECKRKHEAETDKSTDEDNMDQVDSKNTAHVQDPDFEPEFVNQKTSSSYNMNSLPNLASACDRTAVSSRKAAILTSAVLEDLGMVNQDDFSGVIDKNKLNRQRSKSRSEQTENAAKKVRMNNSLGLYFDGKKDETTNAVVKGGVKTREKVTEEHYTLILEPNSVYKAHVTPKSGSAQNISSAIYDEMGPLMKDIYVIGCDGTNTNVGKKGGVIRILETKVDRPLQWSICLLHMNELPLRHLIRNLDGETTGPKSFLGPLGKQLVNAESIPIVDFEPIDAEELNVTTDDLSTDQQYLAMIYNAVRNGSVDEFLCMRDPGNISHARWLTTANRFLRLYVATENPSEDLVRIVKYIMKCYVPTWFDIKSDESIFLGSLHLYSLIKRFKSVDDKTCAIVRPVIQHNAYFAHAECILLSMLVDADITLRKLACLRIKKARDSDKSDRRIYALPVVNFQANTYTDMISWVTPYTDPPILSGYSLETINLMSEESKVPEEVFGLPCHNQKVERVIKLVSETATKAISQRDREGIVHTVLASREELPKFENKGHFKIKWQFGAGRPHLKK